MVFGPIVDAFGRRRPPICGLVGFIVTSLWAAAAGGATSLITARGAQGLCAAVLFVSVFSMVRDVAGGVRAAQLFAVLMTIVGLAPVLAPTLGGFVDSVLGWRAVLVVLAAMGVIALGVALVSGSTGIALPGVVAWMFVALIGVGIGEPTLMAIAMSSQTTSLGSAAAVLGAMQLGISSAATPLAGLLAERGAVPWLLLLLISAAVSAVVVWIAAGRRVSGDLTDLSAH